MNFDNANWFKSNPQMYAPPPHNQHRNAKQVCRFRLRLTLTQIIASYHNAIHFYRLVQIAPVRDILSVAKQTLYSFRVRDIKTTKLSNKLLTLIKKMSKDCFKCPAFIYSSNLFYLWRIWERNTACRKSHGKKSLSNRFSETQHAVSRTHTDRHAPQKKAVAGKTKQHT